MLDRNAVRSSRCDPLEGNRLALWWSPALIGPRRSVSSHASPQEHNLQSITEDVYGTRVNLETRPRATAVIYGLKVSRRKYEQY